MLTKSRLLLVLAEKNQQGEVIFTPGPDTEEPYVEFSVDRWAEMGEPATITVTIEPGDLLND